MKPKCVLLASGTLSPFENIEKQLRYKFDIKFSAMPNLDTWKKSFMVIKMDSLYKFNENKKIVLNFKARNDV